MAGSDWNPWKWTAIGMGLVGATAIVTGLVVAQWSGGPSSRPAAESTVARAEAPAARRAESTAPAPRAASGPVTSAAPRVPTQAVIDACHQSAARQVGQRNKTVEVVKDGAIGAVVGAAVGAAGGAIADGGSGAGKGAAIGGILGAGGGSLYGLNDNQKHDERYREAYSACMRSRGYTG